VNLLLKQLQLFLALYWKHLLPFSNWLPLSARCHHRKQ